MEIIPEIGKDPAKDVADDENHDQQPNRRPPSEWQNAPCALHHM